MWCNTFILRLVFTTELHFLCYYANQFHNMKIRKLHGIQRIHRCPRVIKERERGQRSAVCRCQVATVVITREKPGAGREKSCHSALFPRLNNAWELLEHEHTVPDGFYKNACVCGGNALLRIAQHFVIIKTATACIFHAAPRNFICALPPSLPAETPYLIIINCFTAHKYEISHFKGLPCRDTFRHDDSHDATAWKRRSTVRKIHKFRLNCSNRYIAHDHYFEIYNNICSAKYRIPAILHYTKLEMSGHYISPPIPIINHLVMFLNILYTKGTDPLLFMSSFDWQYISTNNAKNYFYQPIMADISMHLYNKQ